MARGKITVHRKGYWRGLYTYRRGGKTIHVKRHYVPPTTFTVRDRGAKGKGPKVILIKKGALTKHGYSTKKSARARHAALKKAIKEYGALSVYRKLMAQVILRKRQRGGAKKVFQEDAEWVKRNFKVDGFGSQLTPEAPYARKRSMYSSISLLLAGLSEMALPPLWLQMRPSLMSSLTALRTSLPSLTPRFLSNCLDIQFTRLSRGRYLPPQQPLLKRR